MNCPNCGAVVKEGKFCNYCGAKLPDDTKRVEVNISKRIEDVAEMRRADYETDESKLKQRQMKAEFTSRKVRRWTCLILLVVCAVMFIIGFNIKTKPMPASAVLAAVIGLFGGVSIAFYIIYLLLKGKW